MRRESLRLLWQFGQVKQGTNEILSAFQVLWGWRYSLPNVLAKCGLNSCVELRAGYHEPELAGGILVLGLEALLRRQINHTSTLRKLVAFVNAIV